MFLDLFNLICSNSGLLTEALSQADISRMKDELATPEILPCTFDVSFPGWLGRIKHWGKIEIFHKDPENSWGKKRITPEQFLDRLRKEDSIGKLLGEWEVQKKGLTKVEFIHNYIGKNGKPYTEKFIVNVKLKKELR